MFSNKLVEYLQYTDAAKQALDPNFRKQYDFQIREKVEEAISHFKLLISSHSEDQQKKIFSDERMGDISLILDHAVHVTKTKPPQRVSILDDDTGYSPTALTLEEEEERQKFDLRKSLILPHIENAIKCFMPENDVKAHDEFKREYGTSSRLKSKMDTLKFMSDYSQLEIDRFEKFIKSEGLEKKFKAQKQLETQEILREALKKENLPEEKIDRILKNFVKKT